MFVRVRPCSSRALCLLGTAQLALYDCKPPQTPDARQILQDAKQSFSASIALEGTPASGEPRAELTAAAQTVRSATTAVSRPAASQPTARGGAVGRGGAGARPARGAAAAASGQGTGRAAATGSGTARLPAQAPAVTRPLPTTPAAAATQPVAPSATPSDKTDAAKSLVADSAAEKMSTEPVVINAKSYQSRLGLARVLSRQAADLNQVKKLYTEAIDMAPYHHSAYIEVAELLVDKDPLGAVDIYSRFPTAATLTFDDAYIFGEIVRILFKLEAYDDPRLLTNMIAMGKIMGLGALEKYVQTLAKKQKFNTLKSLYAGVNGRSVDDAQMVEFFKMKFWM